jgi:predicted ferric reductase
MLQPRRSDVPEKKSHRFLSGSLWVGGYLLLVLSPLLVLLIGPAPPERRSFWTEFSVVLGFPGMAILGVQFLLTARFRRLAAPYGIDIIYHFHRQMAVLGLLLVLAHPLVLVLGTRHDWGLLDPRDAVWRELAGMAALLAVIVLVVTSIWRVALRIPYEHWRIAHGILAVSVIGFGIAHVVGVGYYLEVPLMRNLWIGMTGIWIGLIGYVRLWKPVRMLLEPYVVNEVNEERGKAWTLVMSPSGHGGIRFAPGQFAWLTIMNSPFAIREHPFSFTGSAEHPETLSFTIKELGDFTSRIGSVRPGDSVYLDGPYGLFSIDFHAAASYVFIVGGVGITPVMSMLTTMADRRDPRPVRLIYANPDWESVTFRERLDSLERRLNLTIVHVLEEAPEEWDGETGYVTREVLERRLPEDRAPLRIFVCGPEPMMDGVEEALLELDIDPGRVHLERFNLV